MNSERMAAPADRACPVCTSAVLDTFKTNFVTVGKCANRDCGHLFAIDTPAGYGVQQIPDADALYERYKERNADLIRFFHDRGFLDNGVKLLDVGAGSGHILRSIRDLSPSTEITCVEADPESARRLRAVGFPVWDSLAQLSGTFGSILLVEVVEHVDDPVPFMKSIRSYLAEGGLVFITTPCGELRNGSRSTTAYDTREHVQFFTERSLTLCMAKAGFSNFRCETMNVMESKLTPPPMRYVKDALRPLRGGLIGHMHLTGFARY